MPHVDDHITQTAFALWLEQNHREAWNHNCVGGQRFDQDEMVGLGASVALPYLKVVRDYTAGVSTNLEPAPPATREEAMQRVRYHDLVQLSRFCNVEADGAVVPHYPELVAELEAMPIPADCL